MKSNKVSKQTTNAHLIVGVILVFLISTSLAGDLLLQHQVFAFVVFFFGVWAGVELGRYLEHHLPNSLSQWI